MKLPGLLLIQAVFIIHGVQGATPPPATTAWPEICRVMSLYRTCDDSTFRIACSYLCGDLSGSCTSRNMLYIPTKGKCYSITKDGLHLWAYAMNTCIGYGATLAVLKDESDAEVFTYLNTAIGGSETRFLVGAVSIGKDRTWVNSDGTEEDGSYWVSSKPDSANFLCMYSEKSQSYKKNSDSCTTNRGFICADE